MEVQGTFNPKLFYETLARIIAMRENVSISVKVTQPEPEEERKTA